MQGRCRLDSGSLPLRVVAAQEASVVEEVAQGDAVADEDAGALSRFLMCGGGGGGHCP